MLGGPTAYWTFTGRTVAVNRDRRHVHSFAPPQPEQKNSCLSTSKATGRPQPHACGVGARIAWTRGVPPWKAEGEADSARASVVWLMEVTSRSYATLWDVLLEKVDVLAHAG